jgi:Phytanoyl-CoA dioxygenase (PhyH)
MKRDLARDGAVVVRGLFSPADLKKMREALDHGIAHPGPMHAWYNVGTPWERFNDNGNPENRSVHVETIKASGLDDFVASLWDTEHLWYIGEELFIKKGANGGRSLWDQDTSYVPVNRPHMLNVWTSFEKLPRFNALEFVRGSHNVRYNGTTYDDLDDPTKPMWLNCDWPRLPDIEADRAENPRSWDIFTWDVEPGDALVFHPGLLHGGAPLTPDCPDRHTLMYRFQGDKLFYRPLPTGGCGYRSDPSEYNDPSLRPGEPYRSTRFTQLR